MMLLTVRRGSSAGRVIPGDLADKISAYFASDLYQELETRRRQIQAFANERVVHGHTRGRFWTGSIDKCSRNEWAAHRENR